MDISEPCPIVQPQFKPLQREHYKANCAALLPALAWAAKSQRRCDRVPNTNQCLSHLGVFLLNVHKTEHVGGLGNKVKVTITHVQSLCIYDGQTMLSHTLLPEITDLCRVVQRRITHTKCSQSSQDHTEHGSMLMAIKDCLYPPSYFCKAECRRLQTEPLAGRVFTQE